MGSCESEKLPRGELTGAVEKESVVLWMGSEEEESPFVLCVFRQGGQAD